MTARPLRPVAWCVALAAVLVWLWDGGRWLLPEGGSAAVSGWLTSPGPADVVIGAARVLGLLLAAYLLVVSALALAAGRHPGRRSAALLGAVAGPAVRRLLGAVLGGAILVGAATASTRPGTHATARPAVVLVVETPVPDPPPDPTATAVIEPLPPLAPPVPGGAAPAVATSWVVGAGEHFWSVAEQVLARAWGRPPTDAEVVPYWQALITANRAVLVDPADPDLLFAGQVLALPGPPPPPASGSGLPATT